MKNTAHYFKICIFLYILCVNNAFSYAPEVILYNRKTVTPSVMNDETDAKPARFGTTNNLRRKVGSPFLAKGEYLLIEGYLTDLMGNPIHNAKIKIWQANTFGYYNHLVKHTEDDNKYDVDFIGSGTATTNNLGHYSFITIIPGYYGQRAPHINFIIESELLNEPFYTEMYFTGHPRNTEDAVFTNFNEEKLKLINPQITLVNPNNPADGKYAVFNIKLDWLHPYKSQ